MTLALMRVADVPLRSLMIWKWYTSRRMLSRGTASKYQVEGAMTAMQFLVLAIGGIAVAQSATASPVEPRTAAAVVAADEAWGAAENRGDAAFVEQLLLPGYQSIGSTGKATSREAIVAGARLRSKSADAVAKATANVAAWRAAHPMRSSVAIDGDTAVLTWISTKPSAGEPVSSSDIFVYRDGHWHAIYSQHSEAST